MRPVPGRASLLSSISGSLTPAAEVMSAQSTVPDAPWLSQPSLHSTSDEKTGPGAAPSDGGLSTALHSAEQKSDAAGWRSCQASNTAWYQCPTCGGHCVPREVPSMLHCMLWLSV